MPTKSANGGALLYIKDTINYKLRPNLNVEKEKELESIFIEILQKTSKNIIIGCIYRHQQINSPNSIPTQIIKISNQIIYIPITYLINFSFWNGIFLDLLKTSNVIPAFKRGENQEYNNCRPISLISNSRPMEKIVHLRLYSLLEKNSPLWVTIWFSEQTIH